jgi:hypothetical protein
VRPREENSAVHDEIEYVIERYRHGSPPAEVTRAFSADAAHARRNRELSTDWKPGKQRGRLDEMRVNTADYSTRSRNRLTGLTVRRSPVSLSVT